MEILHRVCDRREEKPLWTITKFVVSDGAGDRSGSVFYNNVEIVRRARFELELRANFVPLLWLCKGVGRYLLGK